MVEVLRVGYFDEDDGLGIMLADEGMYVFHRVDGVETQSPRVSLPEVETIEPGEVEHLVDGAVYQDTRTGSLYVLISWTDASVALRRLRDGHGQVWDKGAFYRSMKGPLVVQAKSVGRDPQNMHPLKED